MSANKFCERWVSAETEPDDFQAKLGGTESTADIDKVARTRAGAENRLPASDFAQNRDAEDHDRALRSISANQADVEFARRARQA